MEYYRYVYRNSLRWDGTTSLTDKTVIVYCEQGNGDIIQFLRFLPDLKATGCKIILHCSTALHPLLQDDHFDKNNPELPPHDYHVLLLDLPFLLKKKDISSAPYLFTDKTVDLETTKKKVGIAWEGSLTHDNNVNRCCPLRHFKRLVRPEIQLFCLQKEFHLLELQDGCEDLDLFGVPLNDYGDTATLINSLDLVVTVDTSVLHLAGALGKKAYGLFTGKPDVRWVARRWYDSVEMFGGATWDAVFDLVEPLVKVL